LLWSNIKYKKSLSTNKGQKNSNCRIYSKILKNKNEMFIIFTIYRPN